MSRKGRILIVDDDERNRKLLAGMLKVLGYESDTAEDGFRALSKVKQGFDLVLLDVMMPGMDGFEVVRRIRSTADCEDIPIIMVTILAGREDRLKAVETGANDFISKPLDILELRVRVASLIKMKEAQDAIKRHRDELEATVEKRTKALMESEQRFRTVFETAEDCIFIKGVDLRYTHVNPAFEAIFHVPASRLIGFTEEDLLGSEEGRRAKEVDERVLKGEFIEKEQTRLVRGVPVTFHEIRMPMTDPSGAIVGLCGIARNITDRKRAVNPPMPTQSSYLSTAMRATMAQIEPAIRSDSIVLITGESGCGKDRLARHIHDNSKRKTGPFFSINCAAVPAELAESELFGHEAGAFTGAARRKKGLLELAEGGTILLNEIGELSLSLQAKLLTFLDSKTFTRVGGEKSLSVNARVMAATNRKLEKEVEEGRFRADLFHRLNVLSIKVPPLRERTDDIPALAAALVSELAVSLQLHGIPAIDAETMERLRGYSWPGNVRELKNVLERSLILATEGLLSVDLPQSEERPSSDWSWVVSFPLRLSLDELTKDLKRSLIEEALRLCEGRRIKAAGVLGITRAALKRQMQTLGFYGPE